MTKRKLGNSNLEVAPLALGTNVFGWTADEKTSFKVLDAFISAGFNLIDTADIYSAWVPGHKGGESETIIGNWLHQSGKRSQAIIATKVGMDMGNGKKGLSKSHILQAADESLKRLQTDYIDLYQAHRDDPNVPLQETLEAFSQLIKQGKVRAIGASNYSAERLAEALTTSEKNGLASYQSLQPNYNLYDRADYESALEPLCRKKNIAVINYYSLASGFLTGKYRTQADLSKSPRGQSVGKKYLNDRGLRILAALDELSKEYHSTPAGIALAWQMARPGITAPIASATSVEQLKDLTAAANIQLNRVAIERLDQASAY